MQRRWIDTKLIGPFLQIFSPVVGVAAPLVEHARIDCFVDDGDIEVVNDADRRPDGAEKACGDELVSARKEARIRVSDWISLGSS